MPAPTTPANKAPPRKTPSAPLSSLYTFLNVLALLDGRKSYWFAGRTNFYVGDQPLAKITPEERNYFLDAYRGALNLKDFPGDDALDKYTKSRISSISGFPDVKTPDGTESIASKLGKAGGVGAQLSNEITKSLGNGSITTIADDFKKEMSDFKKFIESSDNPYHVQNVVDQVYRIRDSAKKKITAHQDQEIIRLTTLFADPNFSQSMIATLGCSPPQLDDIKTKMLSTLKTNHAKTLKEFDDSFNEPIKKLHAAAKIEDMRINYLARLYDNPKNKEFRDEINRLHAQNQKKAGNLKAGNLNVALTPSPGRAIFDGINIQDLTTIRSITGRKIVASKDADGKDVFEMEMPRRFFSWDPLYYVSGQNRCEADLTSLAQEVRACGYDCITMNINHKNQEFAIELARNAYAGCRSACFEDKNTTIMVNGKKMTASELFADCPSRLKAINKRAATEAKEVEDQEKFDAPKYSQSLKNDYQQYLATAAAAAGAPGAAAPAAGAPAAGAPGAAAPGAAAPGAAAAPPPAPPPVGGGGPGGLGP